jgi:hypothetical protein
VGIFRSDKIGNLNKFKFITNIILVYSFILNYSDRFKIKSVLSQHYSVSYYFKNVVTVCNCCHKKVKAIFKLRGNRDRVELAHCVALTMPVEAFSHVQYSTLPSFEWQQRGRKHGRCFASLYHRKTTWRSAVSLGKRSETCGNSPSFVG